MTTIIKPGMLIRGLRNKYDVDTVLSVDADGRCVLAATKHSPGGVAQAIDGTEEVRWPWEETWTPIKTKHEPARGDIYVHSEGRSTYMVAALADGLRLVCVSSGWSENEHIGFYWSNTSLFGGDDSDFEYVGRAEDILRVDA